MQILIVEDEPRAANQLQKMLDICHFEYQLLDVLDTVEDTISWFQSGNSSDLVFMDIQLADGLSFEVFQKVEVETPIIFTTAFDQYAIQAFKVNSIDYLLKPIQKDDLSQALEKFSKSNKQQGLDNNVLKELLGSIQKPKQRQGILVKEGGGLVQLAISDLLYVYSEDSVTFGVTASKRYIINETLDQLFATIDPDEYFKINRGQVVSKKSIVRIDPYFNHRVKLSIKNPKDQEFIVSRQKTPDFKDWMNS